jgi:O-antigen ligase
LSAIARAGAPAGISLPSKKIADAALALVVFLSGFVIFEPAPYELLLAATLATSLLAGMRIPLHVTPLLALYTLFVAGGVISSFQIADWGRGLTYMAVTLFLALSAIYFAIVVAEDMGRLRLIFRAYVVAATLTALLGVLGYFGLPGFAMFTRYSRAMGAFQDPNVFAPYLVAPALYLMYGMLNRSASLIPVRALMLAILLAGLFLAFSRAAWGLFLICAAAFYFLLLVNERSAKVRLKYLAIAGIGALAAVLALAVALQFDPVAKLFTERFKLVQEYDGGHTGRFARHAAGYLLALEKPLGIGPLEFGFIFTADTHNNFLKALLDYGWLGFANFMALMLSTLVAGFRMLFRPRPWQPYLQIAYVVFAGHFLIGNVIDTDHWRHFYWSIGLVWGCLGLELQWRRKGAARA